MVRRLFGGRSSTLEVGGERPTRREPEVGAAEGAEGEERGRRAKGRAQSTVAHRGASRVDPGDRSLSSPTLPTSGRLPPFLTPPTSLSNMAVATLRVPLVYSYRDLKSSGPLGDLRLT